MAILVGALPFPTIHLACSATRCEERFPPDGEVALRATPSTLRYAATVEGWRHDRAGDWCPWHSPEMEADARRASPSASDNTAPALTP